MNFLICSIIGYAIGMLNPAFFIGKFKGFDIRNQGSRNAGTSNAFITMGKLIGTIVGLFDIFKPMFAIELAKLFVDYEHLIIVVGVFTIIGHMYPIYLNFKGGKGFASLVGLVLYYKPLFFVIALSICFVIGLLTNYIVIVTITFTASLPIYFSISSNFDIITMVLSTIICCIIIYKHMPNVKQILTHEDLDFANSFRKKTKTIIVSDNEDVNQDTTEVNI